MLRRLVRSERGQTAIEYLLLIAVAVGIGLTFMKKMDAWLLDPQTGRFSRQLKSITKTIKTDSRYKSFTLQRSK